MHPKDGAILTTAREKLFATDSTSYDITHKRVAFGQICCEIHLFPLISFFNPQAGKAKIGTDRVRTYEINLSIFWLNINVFGVGFLAQLLHAEYG